MGLVDSSLSQNHFSHAGIVGNLCVSFCLDFQTLRCNLPNKSGLYKTRSVHLFAATLTSSELKKNYQPN